MQQILYAWRVIPSIPRGRHLHQMAKPAENPVISPCALAHNPPLPIETTWKHLWMTRL